MMRRHGEPRNHDHGTGPATRLRGKAGLVESVRFVIGILLALFYLAMSSTATAESARSLVASGNQAYKQGKFDEALAAYEKAAVAEPESPQLYFNRGAAQYAKGDFLKAVDLFTQAAEKTKDLALEARSRYNIGNCYFRESERQRDSDLQKSLEALQQSITGYQQALQLDPTLTDAAHNIEVARLAMKEILDALKKQQEQAEKEQKQKQQAADKLKELIGRQEKLAKDTEAAAKQEQETDAAKAETGKLTDQQEKLKSDTGELAKQLAAALQKSDKTAAGPEEHMQQATAAQEKAGKHLRANEPADAHDSQEKAVDELKKALAGMENKGGQGQGRQQEQEKQQGKQGQKQAKKDQKGQEQQKEQEAAGNKNAAADAKKEGGKQEEKQAAAPMATANDILNEEKENRQQRQQQGPGGFSPVEKDW